MSLNSLYTSKDGAKKFQMIITYKKGTVLNGKPNYLYAYGGFNISLTQYSQCRLIENGGVYAVLIYVGGEYGKKWHDAGTK
jgi:prolyl oligopeptidase